MKEVRLVLLGFGNVGQALARLLEQRNGFAGSGARLVLAAVFDRGGAAVGRELVVSELISLKQGAGSVSEHPQWGRRGGISVGEVLDGAPGSVLVDTSPTNPETGEPGLSAARLALERGHSVVLASKGPLVAGFEPLMSAARSSGVSIGFSAAVGTPLPSLETALLGLRGCELSSFRGLFNESSNRILREMEGGVSCEDAVENAREAGVLETDPRLDLDGWDTAFKVLILARTVWDPGAELDPRTVRGITGISLEDIAETRRQNQRIRLLGSAQRDESGDVAIRVEPARLGSDDPLYPLGPGEKAAVFDSDLMGRFVIRSGKAGPFATAAAIVKDTLNIVAHPPVLAI